MLKYITIPLSSDCGSFCHFENDSDTDGELIDAGVLSKAVVWAMKENLSIQIVYPCGEVTDEIEKVLETVDHVKIMPADIGGTSKLCDADIVVCEDFSPIEEADNKIYIVRSRFSTLVASSDKLKKLLLRASKVNIVITDIHDFRKEDVEVYREFLNTMASFVADCYADDALVHLNIITDRLLLDEMNNCNAGCESIAVSLRGDFYPCVGLFGREEFCCGSVDNGYGGHNLVLFHRDHAPICKICDAYHCKRCTWLNAKLTHEVNTPGWQQCYLSHLEREASASVLAMVNAKRPDLVVNKFIPELNYFDPYTIIKEL